MAQVQARVSAGFVTCFPRNRLELRLGVCWAFTWFMTSRGGAANIAAELRGRGWDAATSLISAYWCTRIVSVGPCM